MVNKEQWLFEQLLVISSHIPPLVRISGWEHRPAEGICAVYTVVSVQLNRIIFISSHNIYFCIIYIKVNFLKYWNEMTQTSTVTVSGVWWNIFLKRDPKDRLSSPLPIRQYFKPVLASLGTLCRLVTTQLSDKNGDTIRRTWWTVYVVTKHKADIFQTDYRGGRGNAALLALIAWLTWGQFSTSLSQTQTINQEGPCASWTPASSSARTVNRERDAVGVGSSSHRWKGCGPHFGRMNVRWRCYGSRDGQLGVQDVSVFVTNLPLQHDSIPKDDAGTGT